MTADAIPAPSALSVVLCRSDDAPEALRNEERRGPRSRVVCHVAWDHQGRDAQAGQILDVSAEGLFVGADITAGHVQVGDEVWGRLEVGGRQYVFLALVRWRGYSYAHGCEGMGVELRIPCHDLVWAVRQQARAHTPA